MNPEHPRPPVSRPEPARDPRGLSDTALKRELQAACRAERRELVRLLKVLAEFGRRRLNVPSGKSSLYAYCVEVLTMSEGEAYRRIHAARAAERFPEIYAMLERREIHLSAVSTLAPRRATTRDPRRARRAESARSRPPSRARSGAATGKAACS